MLPFISTTPTTGPEPSVPPKREQSTTPPPRSTLPPYRATTAIHTMATTRTGTRTRTAARAATIRKGEKPKNVKDEEDPDPIMDFDDTDDDNVAKASKAEQKQKTIVSTFAPTSPPGRRFVLPANSTATSHPGSRIHHQQQHQGNPPDSPSNRKLRPVSEIPPPIAPAFLQAQQQRSPKRRGGSGPGSPPGKLNKTHLVSASGVAIGSSSTTVTGTDSPTGKKTPTKTVSAIGRSLINVQPPAPLGPQLLQIAKESKNDMEHVQKRRRLEEKDKAVDRDTNMAQLILEHASKLTPIDQIKWPPAKPGRFHIFALIMYIGPEEQIVTKIGQSSSKRQLSICDQSATSFKLDLWKERCQWTSLFKTGDVVLITGGTSAWSKLSRLDGSNLTSYRGNPTLETFLKVFTEKRRTLALDLLDKNKGIVRDPSYYMTLHLGSGPTLGSALDTTRSGKMYEQGRLQQHEKEQQQRAAKSDANGLTSLLPTSSTVVSSANSNKTSAISVGVSKACIPILSTPITGASIRANVVYRMLITPGDESQGWEVGACTSSGRFIKIHCQNSASWISSVSPGRLFHFFGRLEDKSNIFQIDAKSREPYSLSDDAWNTVVKKVEARQFSSIRSLREHKFMGNAILDAYILAASFPDLISAEDGQNDHDMYGFIQCYCTGCHSAAVTSPQNPSILFCPFCHLDPQRNHHPLEWMYPGFELSLGDKPRLSANLSIGQLQLRCQHEIGDQVFVAVPASSWMEDEEEFSKSRGRWKRLVELMNNASSGHFDRDVTTGLKVRVEIRVGMNMTKALRVDYL
ncbi:hypothetical protein BGZ65_004538 [Modicella reniformis]|uniref:Uncharacterized protein n=1 Tax=Modicella reniformis TaxID=1440133 RepID=A0A9P6M2X2_9FUNG|nr:hypothetical protein BGZ65_004538 [Modicella reniformis]